MEAWFEGTTIIGNGQAYGESNGRVTDDVT